MKLLPIILRCLLGLVFILSGILKLYPIEPFEYNLGYLPGVSLQASVYLARIIISAELFLGLLLILGISMRKLTLPMGIVMLVAFTAYLLQSIILEGGQDNCGCFGTFLEMSSTESLVKNVIMLGLLLFLYKKPGEPLLRFSWLWVPALIVSLSMPVILNPPWYYADQVIEYSGDDNSLDLTKLPPLIKENEDTLNLKDDEYQLIAFMSVECDHCKNAALRLGVAKEKGYIDEVYVYFFGDEDEVLNFFKETRSKFPYTMFNSNAFFKYSGKLIPAFILVKDGKIIKRWNNVTFTASEIQQLSTYK